MLVKCVMTALMFLASGNTVLRGTITHNRGLIGMRIHQGHVSCVHYNSPAQWAGILPGDKIIKVNFQPFTSEKINGDEGDVIYITVLRDLPELTLPNSHYDKTSIQLTFQVQYVRESQIDYKTPPAKFYEDKEIIEGGPKC